MIEPKSFRKLKLFRPSSKKPINSEKTRLVEKMIRIVVRLFKLIEDMLRWLSNLKYKFQLSLKMGSRFELI